MLANTFRKQSYFINPILVTSARWNDKIFLTGRLFADLAIEVQVPIFMVFPITPIVAQHVLGGGVFLNTMDNTFFFKRLQRPVNGNSVRFEKAAFDFGQ